MKDNEGERPDPKAAARASREARLAAALRANLRRRKAAGSHPAGGEATAAKGRSKPESGAS